MSAFSVDDAVIRTPSKLPRVIRRTAARFPVRKIGNDYRDQGRPDDMIPGDPMTSSLLLGISMFFPPGERFMIASARSIEDRISDPQLRDDLDAFVRQESQHAAEHSKANKHLAGMAGLDSAEVCREIDALWKFVEEHGSPRVRAGVTAATEHFTAVISEVLLSDLAFMARVPDGKAKQMFVWHAIEECEHKAVMFDAFQEIGGTEVERMAIMAAYTVPVVLAALLPAWRLIVGYGHVTNVRGWVRGTATMASLLKPLLSSYFHYYRPGFHPDHRPTRHLEQYWRDQLQIVDDGRRTA